MQWGEKFKGGGRKGKKGDKSAMILAGSAIAAEGLGMQHILIFSPAAGLQQNNATKPGMSTE